MSKLDRLIELKKNRGAPRSLLEPPKEHSSLTKGSGEGYMNPVFPQ